MFSFSERSRVIMQNWEDIHECKDERDDERLRKKAALTSESIAMTNSITQSSRNIGSDEDIIFSDAHNFPRKDFLVIQTIDLLEQSLWLMPFDHCDHSSTVPSNRFRPPSLTPSSHQIKEWMNAVKKQENFIAQKRQLGDIPMERLMETPLIKETENTQGNQNLLTHLPQHCLPTNLNDISKSFNRSHKFHL